MLNTLGSPATIAVLAALVSAGLAITLVTSIRLTDDRELAARQSVALSEISGITIGLLVALQDERVLAHVLETTDAATAQMSYEDSFEVTDRRIGARAAVTERHAAVHGEPTPQDEAATVAALDSLESVRATILRDEAEDSGDLYADVIGPVRDGLLDQVLPSPNREQTQLRRAMTNLLTAMDAAGRRMTLVHTMITEDRALTQDDLVQLLILERDFVARVETAASLTAEVPPTASGVDLSQAANDLLVSRSTEAVRAALDEIAARRGTVTTREWLDVSMKQIDDLVRLAIALNDEVTTRAEEDVDAAHSRRISLSWLFGSVFVLSLVAGASAIVASRERTRALREHDALLAGVRRWFRRETMPEVPGLEYEMRYQPAAEHTGTGGDWYDVLLHPDGGLLIVLGDVAGHGPETVSHVAELRNILRGVAQASPPQPAGILESVDATARSGRLTTVFLAHLSRDLSQLTWSRAGHMPGILRRSGGSAELLLGTSDLPVGVDPSVPRHEQVIDLHPGDAIVLFTDGLIEHRQAYLPDDIERLRRSVAAVIGGPSDIADRVEALRDPSNLDDSSLLIVQREMGARTPSAQPGVTRSDRAPQDLSAVAAAGRESAE